MGILTKGMIGKEDLEIQYNTNAAETVNRSGSTGGSVPITKIPDIWNGLGKINVKSAIIDGIDYTAHHTTHENGGGDQMKLDDLATPDNNTDLDATTVQHGLCPKLGGGTTNFLRADGTWEAPVIPPIVSNIMSYGKTVFGDGTDGDLVVSTDTTLGAGSGGILVKNYNDLTIDAGQYLQGNASDKVLVLLVAGTLTINGTIKMNGRGGAGGAAHASDAFGGGAGAFGGGGGGGAAGGGGGGYGSAGSKGSGSQLGGGGEFAGSNGFQHFGVGGNGTVVTAGTNLLSTLNTALPFEIARYLYGGGGGGGSGVTSGSGGAGGGVIWIEAENIVWGASGVVSCNGVNGSNGTFGAGGGGAGGFVQIIYKTKTGTATIQTTAGAGGTGTAGAAGATGCSVQVQVE